MSRVLIISTLYSQMQHIKSILQRHRDTFRICGTADNSVLGMSLIESTQPDLVVMPVHMNFWNAEDLINYLLPRGICPTFVLLLDEGDPTVSATAATKVSCILPSSMPSDMVLVRALMDASERQTRERADLQLHRQENDAVQHSLEVMELIMGLSPLQTREAQQKFGRLRVGNRDCWLLLGSMRAEEESDFHFFLQIDMLNDMFRSLTELLEPLGACEICIYQESNLCILLEEGQPLEPDWEIWVQNINRLLGKFGVPTLVFDISDMPLPLNRWHSQCRELIQMRKARFFFSPSFLQSKIIKQYQSPVSQSVLNEYLSSLSLAMQGLHRLQALEAVQALEDLVTRSLSQEVYSYVVTQMLVQYNSLCYSFAVKDRGEDLTIRASQVYSVAQVFSLYREMLLRLLEQLGHYGTSSNQIVVEVCRYINNNLAEPLTLEIVAAHVHVNSTYLSRLFKKEAGTPFNTYINQLRIQRAAQLLETGRKVTDIAGMVGFENAKYFSQVFKKHMGMTPQEYRQTYREESLK